MFLVRVDNRLIHGQVIETWIPFTGARFLLVVNDDVAGDVLRQEIMSLAVPANVECAFCAVDALEDLLDKTTYSRSDTLVLFAGCEDVRRAWESGLRMDSLNIGNVHYGPGKKQVCPHVALSADDETCLKFLSESGVDLDFRCVPNETSQPRLPW